MRTRILYGALCAALLMSLAATSEAKSQVVLDTVSQDYGVHSGAAASTNLLPQELSAIRLRLPDTACTSAVVPVPDVGNSHGYDWRGAHLSANKPADPAAAYATFDEHAGPAVGRVRHQLRTSAMPSFQRLVAISSRRVHISRRV